MVKFIYKYIRQVKIMKEGQPKSFTERLKNIAVFGGIIAGVIGLIKIFAK